MARRDRPVSLLLLVSPCSRLWLMALPPPQCRARFSSLVDWDNQVRRYRISDKSKAIYTNCYNVYKIDLGLIVLREAIAIDVLSVKRLIVAPLTFMLRTLCTTNKGMNRGSTQGNAHSQACSLPARLSSLPAAQAEPASTSGKVIQSGRAPGTARAFMDARQRAAKPSTRMI